jgi:hypothetical protein
MPRTRILVAALATLALAAPAASAEPHYPGYPHDRPPTAQDDTAPRAEVQARGRDGVQTGSLAGTTDETTRALEQERAYSTYGTPAPVTPKPAPAPIAGDDGTPWVLIGAGSAGIALLLATAVLLIARPRRVRVAA